MPIPAILASLGPLFAEAGGAAAAGGATAQVGAAASGAGASGLMSTEMLTQALTSAMSGGGGGGPGGPTGFGLGGKIPSQFIPPGVKILMPFIEKSIVGQMAKLPKALVDWGDSLLQSKRNLMAFNGAIAGTILETERRDIHRKIGEGQRVSGSTEFLGEGLSDFKDSIQPFMDLAVNFFNVAGGTVLRIATLLATIAEWHPLIAGMLALQEELAKREQASAPFVKFIDDIQKGEGLADDGDEQLMEARLR